MIITMKQDHDGNQAGTLQDVPPITAREWIAQGIAVEGDQRAGNDQPAAKPAPGKKSKTE